MKNAFSTILLTGGFLAATSLSALAGGCNWGHAKDATASYETKTIPAEVAEVLDDSQVLSTGQMSVAQIDCTTNSDAAECVGQTSSATN